MFILCAISLLFTQDNHLFSFVASLIQFCQFVFFVLNVIIV